MKNKSCYVVSIGLCKAICFNIEKKVEFESVEKSGSSKTIRLWMDSCRDNENGGMQCSFFRIGAILKCLESFSV